MPIYPYKCEDCGHNPEVFQRMSDRADTVCPKCGGGRYHRVPCLPNTDMREFRKPIEMFSIGMEDDDEIRAFKERCPDVDVSMDPNDELYGVPIARTRKQKLQALNAAGFEER